MTIQLSGQATDFPRTSGQTCWQSPANIALVKYWGKYPVQIPMNPSLSFVLKGSVVKICMDYSIDPDSPFELVSFSLNGQVNDIFKSRIDNYLEGLVPFFPFLKHAQIHIDSESSFPHSAGIASSAAAFSALALCVCSIEAEISGKAPGTEAFLRRASFMARLGSGSACRSIYDGMVLWGKTEQLPGSSDEYAVKLEIRHVHRRFMKMKDAVLIVDSGTKKVSSSAGHALMHHHPYREQRKEQASANLGRLLNALQRGEMPLFGEIIEDEALNLHSLMMSSSPGYILMHPNTIRLLEKIREFRRETRAHAYFTLDAGPNIHLIYPESDAAQVIPFIRDELTSLCRDGRWIDDGMGTGPERIAHGSK